jgi:hypothetical protein
MKGKRRALRGFGLALAALAVAVPTADARGHQGHGHHHTVSYHITVNNFLADGGDGFTALTGGTNRLGGSDDLAAFVEFLAPSLAPGAEIGPPALNRIDVTG